MGGEEGGSSKLFLQRGNPLPGFVIGINVFTVCNLYENARKVLPVGGNFLAISVAYELTNLYSTRY